MKLFVLSLKNSVERRKLMIDCLSSLKIEFEFIDAIVGTNVALDIIEENNRSIFTKGLDNFCSDLNSGEIGCSLSHLAIARRIIDEDYPYAVVLEDDVILDNSFIELINGKLDRQLKDSGTDLMLIGFHRSLNGYNQLANLKYFHRNNRTQTFKFGSPICCYFGTYGYLITQKGASRLLEIQSNLNLLLKADNFINYAWFKGLKLKVLERPIVFPSSSSEISTISQLNPEESSENYFKPKILQSHGFYRIWFQLRIMIYKFGIKNPIYLRKGKLRARNFDEIRNKFFTK
jgi:GR25 family glycosyltransferase involved in LPS biosynthesis